MVLAPGDSIASPGSESLAATPDSSWIKSSSTLEDVLDYTAIDSVYVDMKTRIAHLYSILVPISGSTDMNKKSTL